MSQDADSKKELPPLDPVAYFGEEAAEWISMTPQERWSESAKLWNHYVSLGGSLDPEPDPQSPFFSIRANRVQSLLMGGQACILYGAAEFSREADLAIVADAENLALLRTALDELQASVLEVPPFDIQFLNRGHAVHFRCAHPDAAGVRVDIMSVMRGVDPFAELWERRTTITWDGEDFDVMSLPDLVAAKKTQRDKDWPMIRRLVDVNYFENSENPTEKHLAFWFREMRSADILMRLAVQYPEAAQAAATDRDVAGVAVSGASEMDVSKAMYDEEQRERSADKAYWQSLRRELELLRHTGR